MPSSQEYAQRLLDEATHTLAPLIKGLEADFQNLRNDVSASLSRLSGKLDSLSHLELPTAGTVLTQVFDEISRNRDEEWAGIADFSHKLRQSETQEEILNSLLDQASRYCPKLALFITRGSEIIGYSTRGFSEDAAKNLKSASFPQTESSALSHALAASGPVEVLETGGETRLLDLLGGEAPGPWHLFPMQVMQRQAAVLFAAEAGEKQVQQAACRLLTDMSVLRLENIALQILRELGRVVPESAPAAAAFRPAEPERPKAVADEIRNAAEETSPDLNESLAETAAGEFSAFAPIPAMEEAVSPQVVPEAEAAPASEVMAPMETAPLEAAAETGVVSPEAAEEELETEMEMIHAEILPETPALAIEAEALAAKEDPRLAEEERLHSDAKRFARLLVSEVKLYNEQRVVEGRENRDIYVRLKRDIDRSREMYEKRVAPSVSRRIDYFHDEIIRILGENDPLTLGSDYPGSRIES